MSRVTEAERSVIGAGLQNPDSIRFALEEQISGDDFEDPRLGKVWSLMVGLRSAGTGVDAISVGDAAAERGIPGVDFLYLHQLVTETPVTANVGYWARMVREGGIRRRLTALGLHAVQLADGWGNLDEVMSLVRREWDAVRGSVSAPMEAKPLGEVLDGSDAYDWLIPDLLERMDRVVLTGGEGAGKSTFVRQIAVMAAAGLHPMTGRPIDPIKVLVVDTENTEKQWRRATRPLVTKARLAGSEDPARTVQLACVPRMDITTEKDLGAVHHLVDEHEPDLLVIGPLYRLIPRAINSDDDAAPMIAALDSLRARGLALVMEAHAGHATNKGGDRDLRPRGSSALMGWPEFGFGIAMDPSDLSRKTANLVRWRGDRDERAWPEKLVRGGDWPWSDERTAVVRQWTPHYPAA
ncbi:AAA family ATPase [Cellulomonas sp. ACRRI]|uniref:AAA family ATPase n=1 Tax=Cellulomonas sp. ACRRI TaxID=2918188 RepID=UPI001EF2645E|nr:AAA family ATPase [Cellulomonas sp. ACRRI]MCG7284980.1 AAA family ATPase [Cellulomonas sp. ACRRI]